MHLDLKIKTAAFHAAPEGSRERRHAEVDMIEARQTPRLTPEEDAIAWDHFVGRITREEALHRLRAIGSDLS